MINPRTEIRAISPRERGDGIRFSRRRFPPLRFPIAPNRISAGDLTDRADDTRYIDREIGGLELPPKRNRGLTFLARVRSYERVGEEMTERSGGRRGRSGRQIYFGQYRAREGDGDSGRERTLKILPRIGNGFVWMVSDVGGV